ncbi:MAG: hypothetical protein KDI13_10780 [Alphaproteobacteria bacterium]|nr:hypothetical protein [Alphaproteobacteria bacterium]
MVAVQGAILQRSESAPGGSGRGSVRQSELNKIFGQFSSNDPKFSGAFASQQQQTVMQSLVDGNTQTQSFMQMLRPEDCEAGKYNVSKIETTSLVRDVTKPITDGAIVSEKAVAGMGRIQEAKADFKADFKAAQNEAMGVFEDVCVGMDVNPVDAAKTLMPDPSVCKGSVVANLAATGGGSMATFANAATFIHAVGSESKPVSKEKMEQILSETLTRLQSSGPQDTRANVASISSGADAPAHKSDLDWSAMKVEEFKEFLAADPEQQPEAVEIAQKEDEMKLVFENQRDIRENYGREGDPIAKAFVEEAAGNVAIGKMLKYATVVENVCSADFDAGHANLVGDSVRGTSLSNLRTGFSSENVSKFIDQTRVNTPELTRELTAAMNNHMDYGMRAAV